MYLDFKVKIPSDSAGITRKKIKGTTYIYYAYIPMVMADSTDTYFLKEPAT